MTLRILHIFAPNFKQRFGGPIFDWQYAFAHWDNSEVMHLVLDYDQGQPRPALDAFDFPISSSQYLTSRQERATWSWILHRDLNTYKGQYDLLHFHLLWWGGLLAARWSKRHHIPTLYQSVLLGSDTPGPIRNQKFGKLKAKLLRNFSAIIPISEALSEDYYANDYPKEQVITLMNSVDSDLFHPVNSLEEKFILRQKHGLPLDATILLFTGSIIPRKGLDILIDAFIEAHQKHPELFLILIGPKNKGENPSIDMDFIRELETKISETSVQDKVFFTGLVNDRSKLSDYYRASDIFIFPSRREGLGNVVLEAMASGLPVVVSDLPVLQSVISHQENGIMVPIGDVAGFSKAIITLKENPAASAKLGQNARAYVCQHHSFAQWQSDLTKIYQDLLA